ncbi:MAG: hypothetical protein FJW40_07535 [Acidobacteria bacterium]|nr:hypothetical protein [Acidobacteriota bacterium]
MTAALAFFALLAQPAPRQPAPRQPAPRQPTLKVPFRLESDAKVDRASVAVRINGKAVRLQRLLGPSDGLVLLVISDLTGDIAAADAARQALTAALAPLPPTVFTSLLRAQDGLTALTNPSSNRDALRTAFDTIPVTGYAGLLDTLETAGALADALSHKAAVRTAILYITDSLISNYRTDYTNPVVNSSDAGDLSRRFPEGLIREKMAQLQRAIRARHTPLFILHLRYQTDRLNDAYQTGLLDLATATAGDAAFCRTIADVPDNLNALLTAAQALHFAEVEAPGSKAEGDIAIDAGGVSVKHRAHYTRPRSR